MSRNINGSEGCSINRDHKMSPNAGQRAICVGVNRRSALRSNPIVTAGLAIAGVAAMLSGGLAFTMPASAVVRPGNAHNLLENPGFETVNPAGSYFVECEGTQACGPTNEVAALGWGIHDAANGNGALWATTDLVRSTAPQGGRSMLHVTGTGAGILQDSFSEVTAHWSVSVFPVMGAVRACVEVLGDPAGSPQSCATSTVSGTWQTLTGSYDGTSSGNAPATQITIDGTSSSVPAPYTDFYVDNASVVAG